MSFPPSPVPIVPLSTEFTVFGKHSYPYVTTNASSITGAGTTTIGGERFTVTPQGSTEVTSTWADTHRTVSRTPALANQPNPQTLAVKKTVLVLNNETAPTASIGIEADNSGGVGTYFGMNLFNNNDTDFGVTSTFPYQGSVVFDQEGAGSTTTKTAIKQGTITSSDTANTNAITIQPTSISMVGGDITGSYTGNAFSVGVNDVSNGTAGISGTTLNSAGTMLSSLGGGVAGLPSPPYPAPDANWSISVQTGSFNPTLYMAKSAPFTNSTSVTMDVNGLIHNQGTGSPSPDTDFTISTNKNLLMTADNIDLSTTRLIMPSLASSSFLDYNSATGRMSMTNSNAGGALNPQLVLTNTNGTGSVAMEVYKNKPTGGSNGDTLFTQSVFGKDSGNVKQEYTRIQHTIRDPTAGAEDGSMEMGCFVNGTYTNFIQLNANDAPIGEINFVRPLDFIGGSDANSTIKVSGTGSQNLNIDTTASAGTGSLVVKTKTGGFVNIPSATNATNYIRATPQSATNANRLEMSSTETGTNFRNSIDLLNSQYSPSIELKADFSTGGAVNKSITMTANGTTNFNTLTAYDGQSNNPFQIQATNPSGNGSIELITDNSSGDLILTGTALQSATSGANSGQHLRIKLNGTYYKIRLEDD